MAKILICEPDESLAGALSEAIQRSGLSTVVVGEAENVHAVFEQEQPALVILDLQIGDGQGLDICQALRENPAGELVPILFVGSGEEGVKNFGDALAEGGDYYFQKPLDMHKVVSKIRTYVGVDRDGPTVVSPPPARPEKGGGGPNLAGRVEQMLDLGDAIQKGLLAPPEKSEEERVEELEQHLFGDEPEAAVDTAEPLEDLSTAEEETTKIEAAPKGSAPAGLTEAEQLLPPRGEPSPEVESDESAEFPQKMDKIDDSKPVLEAPEGKEEAQDESSEAVLSRIASELKEMREGETENEADALAKETAAWSEIEEEMEREGGEEKKEEEEKEAEAEAEAAARLEAEEKERKEAEEKARKEAEEKARKEAEEKARKEAEEKARKEAEEKARKEAEEKTRKEAEEKAWREAEDETREEFEVKTSQELETLETVQGMPAVEGPPDEQPAVTERDLGTPEDGELEAESLWQDAADERVREVEDMAQRASDYMGKRMEEEKSSPHLSLVPDSEEEQPSEPTSRGGEKLVELLQKEAKLAREKAAVELDDGQEDRVSTSPDLPPYPGEKVVKVSTEIRRDKEDDQEFEKEKTEDLKPLASPPAAEDEFYREKTSPRLLEAEAGEDEIFAPAAVPELSAPNPEETNLGSEMVPAVLWRFYLQNVTGLVTFTSGGDNKEVFFENGIPVGVRSSQTADRLEEVLFREGLIDRAAYAEARIKGIAQPRALAAHLVERGLLKPDELFPLVRRHLEDCLLGLFEWTEGSTSYSRQFAPDAEKVRLARPLPSLILEGIRRKFLLNRMVQVLGSPASLLAPIPSEDRSPRAPQLSHLGFLKEEREVLNLVNGLRPIEEIVFLSGQNASTVYRVLLVCVVTGLLAVAVRGVRGGDEGADEALQRNLEIGRRRVEAKYEQINHASYFEILGVDPGATTYEIDAAYQRLVREFHPMNFAHADFRDLQDKLEVIHRTLDEAHEVLADELLREGYRQSLS